MGQPLIQPASYCTCMKGREVPVLPGMHHKKFGTLSASGPKDISEKIIISSIKDWIFFTHRSINIEFILMILDLVQH